MTATTTTMTAVAMRVRRRSFRETRLGEDGARDDGSARARRARAGANARSLGREEQLLDMLARGCASSTWDRAGNERARRVSSETNIAMITTLVSLKREVEDFARDHHAVAPNETPDVWKIAASAEAARHEHRSGERRCGI